jgi:predicted DNA-binding transcriptional regulator AlpA
MEPQQKTRSVVNIAGAPYLPATEVARRVGISRTTMWRWRQEGKIPLGRRYRGGLVLFSPAEVESVRSYADRLEPISAEALLRPNRRSTIRGRS